MIGPADPRPRPIPWVSVVLPAPRSPEAMITSPGRSSWASRSPSSLHGVAAVDVDRHRQRLGQDHPVRGGVGPTTNPRCCQKAISSANSPRANSSTDRIALDRRRAPRPRPPWPRRCRDAGSPDGPRPGAARPPRPDSGRITMTPAGRPPTAAKIPAASAQALRPPTPGSPSIAVDGGSSGGRAPNAAWMTSTIAAASSVDATETTDQEPRCSPAAIVVSESVGRRSAADRARTGSCRRAGPVWVRPCRRVVWRRDRGEPAAGRSVAGSRPR